jgi:hypothetical protein
MRKSYFYMMPMLFLCFNLWSQDNWEAEGEVKDEQIIIEKERSIILPPASRRFEKVPPPPKKEDELSVSFNPSTYDAPFSPILLPSRVLRMKKEAKTRLYNNHLKVGYGNYGSPLARLSLNTRGNDTYRLGLKVHHLSGNTGPVRRDESADSNTGVLLHGAITGQHSTLSGNVSYRRRAVNFYGYVPPVNIEVIGTDQVLNYYQVGLKHQYENESSPFKNALEVGFTGLNDNFQSRESDFQIRNFSTYQINSQLSAGLDLTGYFGSFEQGQTVNRNLFSFSPFISYDLSDFNFTVGLTGAFENDQAPNADKFHVFPKVAVTFKASDAAILYGELDGAVERVTFASMTTDNPWIQTENTRVLNSINTLNVEFGVKGRLAEVLSFRAGLRYASFDNLYFLGNGGALDSAQFVPLYDSDITLFNPAIELSFERERWRGTLAFDYFNWGTDTLREAYSRPSVQLKSGISYSISNKLQIQTEMLLMGGINGINLESQQEEQLDPFFDLTLEVNYSISRRAGLFVRAENILSQEYERFLNYPVRGIRVFGGLTFTF